MRELKFRVWYADTKNMVYFLLGETNRYPSNVMSFPVMQFTGLYDKNHNEIYEGDILENGFKEVFVVKWHNGRWVDSTHIEGEGTLCDLYGALEFKKIIGNIYESKALLK